MSAIQISASILAADFGHLAEAVTAAERAGVDMIHVDVMDGRFVPPITMGPVVVEALRSVTRLPLDVHLMVMEPERQVDAFIDAGAARIAVHLEATPHLHRLLGHLRRRGVAAVIAINPQTPPEALEWMLPEADGVLVMSVNPGYAGQEFISTSPARIRRLRELVARGARPVTVAVDGGINEETAGPAAEAGATLLVAASAIFKGTGGIVASVERLRRAAQQHASAPPPPPGGRPAPSQPTPQSAPRRVRS